MNTGKAPESKALDFEASDFNHFIRNRIAVECFPVSAIHRLCELCESQIQQGKSFWSRIRWSRAIVICIWERMKNDQSSGSMKTPHWEGMIVGVIVGLICRQSSKKTPFSPVFAILISRWIGVRMTWRAAWQCRLGQSCVFCCNMFGALGERNLETNSRNRREL